VQVWSNLHNLIPLGATRFPYLAPTGIKNHVQLVKYEVIHSFHDVFVVLQCFAMQLLLLQVATPHPMHPNVVFRRFWASVHVELPDISPKTTLFRFLVGGSVQTEQYRSGNCDRSSWYCRSGSGIVPSACGRFAGIRTLLLSKAFCKSTRNSRTYLY
jgi:hypothetical protein